MTQRISNLTGIRAFLSFNVEDSAIEDVLCIQDDLKTFYNRERITWTKPDNFHLTLRFFGEVTPESIDKLKENLSEIKLYFKTIEYVTQGIGYFPDVKAPTSMFLSLKETKNYTDILMNKFHIVFTKLKFPHTRKFAPHITLGRFKGKSNKDLLLFNEDISNFKLTFDSFHLMKSTLEEKGAVYSIVQSYKFTEE